MLDNLTLLAILITVFWVGALLYYYRTTVRQDDIREDLDSLRQKLDELEGRDL